MRGLRFAPNEGVAMACEIAKLGDRPDDTKLPRHERKTAAAA
jgi:hypothetical protein